MRSPPSKRSADVAAVELRHRLAVAARHGGQQLLVAQRAHHLSFFTHERGRL
jgi:hypothetical protein